MKYSLRQVRARQAVRLAKAELRRWERRYDRHQGGDPMRFIAEIRGAEERYAQAVEVLRLARDGQAHLPEGERPHTARPLENSCSICWGRSPSLSGS